MWRMVLNHIQRLIARRLWLPAQPAPNTPAGLSPEAWLEWMERWEREREAKRQAREQRRLERKAHDRRTFGEETWGVAKSQRDAASDEAKLHRLNLPVFHTEHDLAAWLGIPLTRLRWFTHDKPADRVWHYVRYTIPKRSGGERVILAPKRELKALQRRVLRDLLASVPTADCAHGFVARRSILTNAQPHVGRQVVLNVDLKDFFPSITFPRVRGLLVALGYSFSVASALALLCTEHDREVFERDGRVYFVSVGPRCLVQGAPTSPALANLIAARLDWRLDGLARKLGFAYTRYADDLTFSGEDVARASRLLGVVQRLIREEHFEVNANKTHIFRRSSRQVVTGLVVNDQLSTPRALRRRLRAILHNARKTGLAAQQRDQRKNFRAYLTGLVSFVHAANAQQARSLKKALASAGEKN